MKIVCEVSLGELVDKISILKIKRKKVEDLEKLKFIKNEYKELTGTLDELRLEDICKYLDELEEINTELWEIEDQIREYEKNKDFSEKFIDLARSVYITNDKRFSVKSAINEKYGSIIREVKSYEEY